MTSASTGPTRDKASYLDGRDSRKKREHIVSFPPIYLSFPRTEWSVVTWLWPVFLKDDHETTTRWAGREASKRWAEVLRPGGSGLEALDEVDLALAVFDKTCQLNSYVRNQELPDDFNVMQMSTKAWLKNVDFMVDASYRMAYKTIEHYYPGDPSAVRFLSDETRALVLDFAYAAMTHQWMDSVDSFDVEPTRLEFDLVYFVARYIPDPKSLPPRRAALIDPHGEYEGCPPYLYCDSFMRQVDPPLNHNHDVSAPPTSTATPDPAGTAMEVSETVAADAGEANEVRQPDWEMTPTSKGEGWGSSPSGSPSLGKRHRTPCSSPARRLRYEQQRDQHPRSPPVF